MSLKSKVVTVEGIGEIEFREPLYENVEPLLNASEQSNKLGSELLKLCTYKDGKRLFDGPVGVSTFMKLLAHVGDCLEVCGMDEGKKD
jgi:hypothetical protein